MMQGRFCGLPLVLIDISLIIYEKELFMDDGQIIKLLKNRDDTAVYQTEKKYGKLLFSLAMGILGSSEDAREIVNDSLLALWNSSAVSPPENLKAYLCKITRNQALKRVRRDKAKKRSRDFTFSLEEIGEIFSSSELTEDIFSAKELENAVFLFINGLPSDEKLIFMRRYWFFDSMKNISALSGIKESTVRSILSRTRQKLKEYLRKEGFEV